LVLVAGAGVLIRSFARLVSSDLGFSRERLFAMEVVPADRRPAVLSLYYPELLRAIRQIPSVQYVGAADQLPLIGGATMTMASAGKVMEMVEVGQVLPGYFEALGIPLIAGRFSTDADAGSAQPVVMVSQESARLLFPDTSAMGQRILVDEKPREVIGIVGDVRHWGAATDFGRPKVYLPFGSAAATPLTVVIRTRPGARLPVDHLRGAATAIGPRVFVDRFRPGSEWLSTNTTRARHRTLLFALLGGFGLILALVGIFSMTAYAVANRTRELGVRLALGARADQVVGVVLRDAAWPMGVGVVLGLCGAALATRVIASFLFNTAPTDPWTFAFVAVSLFATGSLAAWLPARHVARIDPVIALRTE
jgi:putative ABC transport system permease protein